MDNYTIVIIAFLIINTLMAYIYYMGRKEFTKDFIERHADKKQTEEKLY